MEEKSNTVYRSNEDLDLQEVIKIIWHGKHWLIGFILLFFLSAIIYVFTLPNIYTSKALLAPNDDQNSLSNSLQSYSGLATLAGITIPSNSSSKKIEAIERLSSLDFFEKNFIPDIKLQNLMAVSHWDSASNRIIYKGSIYDEANSIWSWKNSSSTDNVPSIQESHIEFLKNYLIVDEDNETGFIKVSIQHESPYVAKLWLDILINKINKTIRDDYKRRTLDSINFLNQQFGQTSYAEIKQALSVLIQEETKKLMLIESNEDYIFRTIDPPYVPEKKSKPSRLLISIFFAFIGGIVGTLFLFIRHFFKLDALN